MTRSSGAAAVADRSASPPAIIMGGQGGNALSVARSLGRAGVTVYLLSEAGRSCPERYSRYVRSIDAGTARPAVEAWADYLLGPRSEGLRGAVLLACNDAGIEVILRNRPALAQKFTLDISDPAAQECALNKLCTYEKAVEAGVPAPRFWRADGLGELDALRDDLTYPLLLKPLLSHRFSAVFGRKFLLVNGFDELRESFADVERHGLEVVLLEKIQGPDDLLCSYFTYIDEQGTPLFDFTKRVIRRYPENEGLASYHVTDWNPEVADLGRCLLTHMGLRGLGNVEFKRDLRDGRLKVMEVNARFTAANGLVAASGYDLGLFVYNRLTGRPQPPLAATTYRRQLHMWYPENDTKAFLQLRRERKLTFSAWVKGLACPQVLPYFRWYDPAPAAASAGDLVRRVAGRGARSVAARTGRAAPEAR